jgi:hypothetical protein
MMVSGPNLNAAEIHEHDFEEYSNEEMSDEGEEDMGDEEEEEIYSDEDIDEFHIELHDPSSPHTFEDFRKMFRPEQSDDEQNSTKISEPKVPVKEKIVPQNVTQVPESSPKIKIESSSKMEIKSTKTIYEPLSELHDQQEVLDPRENEFEEDFDEEIEEELEDEEISGKKKLKYP